MLRGFEAAVAHEVLPDQLDGVDFRDDLVAAALNGAQRHDAGGIARARRGGDALIRRVGAVRHDVERGERARCRAAGDARMHEDAGEALA